MAQPVNQPEPARPIYYPAATPRSLLVILAVICYVIALIVGANWVHESAKIDDVLVFLSLGSALFAAGHIW